MDGQSRPPGRGEQPPLDGPLHRPGAALPKATASAPISSRAWASASRRDERGEVTLFRLGGEELRQLWVAEGEIVQTGREEDLCRTQVEIALTRGKVEELLEHPLGNHLVLVHGHHAERLLTWWHTFIKRSRE